MKNLCRPKFSVGGRPSEADISTCCWAYQQLLLEVLNPSIPLFPVLGCFNWTRENRVETSLPSEIVRVAYSGLRNSWRFGGVARGGTSFGYVVVVHSLRRD